jgi:hypothetical protein
MFEFVFQTACGAINNETSNQKGDRPVAFLIHIQQPRPFCIRAFCNLRSGYGCDLLCAFFGVTNATARGRE